MPALIYMIRHGQTDWNAQARLQGQADTALNALGRSQADRNGRRLGELVEDFGTFDFVASPLGRTRETMERVRAAAGLAPREYRTDSRLLEVHFGDWQGQTYEELEAARPGSTDARSRDKWRFVPPGADAESYEMLADRANAWMAERDGPTICVTHGGVIRAAFHLLAGIAPDEAVVLEIPQDRILRFTGATPEWL